MSSENVDRFMPTLNVNVLGVILVNDLHKQPKYCSSCERQEVKT